MWYTFDVDLATLSRIQDHVDRPLQIWHYLDYDGQKWQDHWVTVIDCDSRQALWLYLL